jgi:hypothetical protein
MSRQLRVRGEFSGQIVARKQRQQGLRDYVACMRRPALRLLAATPLIYALACGGAGAAKTPPEPAEHSLSGLAAQHVAVLPAYAVCIVAPLDWSVGRLAELQRTLDADIVAALDDRGVKAWVYPAQLLAAHQRNPTYSTDPYTFAEEPLRAPSLPIDTRLAEPLASQIRAMVALLPDTRLVLAPVELRLERAGTGGRGVLRLVLVDARLSNVRWLGEISSDTSATFGPAITASIAARLAAAVATQ